MFIVFVYMWLPFMILPLAAAFSVVPIVLIALYLSLARRLGAFDAL
jgi:ABC-type spermidine/putrescine transport system permease subunit I